MEKNFWIVVASRDHVQQGVREGIAQACHGKKDPLKRMQAGDVVIYYSSKEYFGKTEKCQKFTAIGLVEDKETYQATVNEDFHPFRRDIRFCVCKEVSILPLIDELEFIPNKKSWGYPFRSGVLKIGKKDGERIALAMLTKTAAKQYGILT